MISVIKELKYGDSLTIKEKETVAEELRKSEDSNRNRQNIANGHMYKEQKLENMPLSMGMRRL